MVKGNEYTFNEGLLEFKDIKCNIMASELASLVPVIDVFEENGTVYSVEANIQGITLSKFLDKRYDSLAAYVPGEQPQDKKYIKLNTNESPFPPSPGVIEAVTDEKIEKLKDEKKEFLKRKRPHQVSSM